ncbi:hypothetical protein G6N74_00280 [Mesorhizobium sp. CGMCC 1.15528]|uniref:Uncharacterized protein n=1 Tax=Mesorhizobium zhangyense TaxID=1776730 RepID=A0A7C9V982_9HYPH|nr:hypothetical protein [Mesorhizobium zhangyense]NGN39491.1 hypothetical protein [Mesorhizobium zhangyense]
MLPLTGLHSLATSRGDGLRPELLALLRGRENVTAQNSNVVDIGHHQDTGSVQAGPNPVTKLGSETPDGVIRFPTTDEARNAPREHAPSRRNI